MISSHTYHKILENYTQQHLLFFFPELLLWLVNPWFKRTLTFPFSYNYDSSRFFFFPCFNNSLHAKFRDYFIICPVFALTSKYVKLYSPAFSRPSSSLTCLSSKSHLFPNRIMMLLSLMFWLHRSIHSGRLVKLFSSGLVEKYCWRQRRWMRWLLPWGSWGWGSGSVPGRRCPRTGCAMPFGWRWLSWP